jgi:uncharacterized membrane protein HdeD (DUF308 family)
MFDLLARNWWVLVVRGVIAILFGVLGRVCNVYSTPNQRMVAAISHMAG